LFPYTTPFRSSPLRAAERERAFFLAGRCLREDFTHDGGADRQHHERDDDAGDERRRGEGRAPRLEDRDEAELPAQPVAEWEQARLEEEQAPEAVDQAR